MRSLDDLGARLAREQDAWLRDRPLRPHRRPLVFGRTKSFAKSPALALSALSLAAAIAISVSASRRNREVQSPDRDVIVASMGSNAIGPHERITTDDAPQVVAFSDGSDISLHAHAELEVGSLSTHGSDVALRRGTLRAHIVHRSRETKWRVLAGQFAIHVTGTLFDVAWDPESETVQVTMLEGRTEVESPCTLRRALVAGETFRATCASQYGRAALAEPSPPANVVASVTSPPEREQVKVIDCTENLPSVDASVLLRLANEARRRGDASRATRCYEKIAARDSSPRESAMAHFQLGVTSASASPDVARHHFEHYLRHSPNGPLASEALGRLVELSTAQSKESYARLYLAQYPNGPHANLARSALKP